MSRIIKSSLHVTAKGSAGEEQRKINSSFKVRKTPAGYSRRVESMKSYVMLIGLGFSQTRPHSSAGTLEEKTQLK